MESTPYTKAQSRIPTLAVRVVEPDHPWFFSVDELNRMIKDSGFSVINSDVEVFREKWLHKWGLAKGASSKDLREIYDIYKNAPDYFIKEQHVEFFDDEMEILNDFPWSIVLAIKEGK